MLELLKAFDAQHFGRQHANEGDAKTSGFWDIADYPIPVGFDPVLFFGVALVNQGYKGELSISIFTLILVNRYLNVWRPVSISISISYPKVNEFVLNMHSFVSLIYICSL